MFAFDIFKPLPLFIIKPFIVPPLIINWLPEKITIEFDIELIFEPKKLELLLFIIILPLLTSSIPPLILQFVIVMLPVENIFPEPVIFIPSKNISSP